jgi:ubiquinone/menaquinone biosynthesis C-methylase UbiE
MAGNHEVFQASRAGHLDSWLRKILFRPDRLVERFIRQGNIVLDIGCGPGLFTRAIARKVGDTGQVIAVDIQDGMLEILKEKAQKEGLINRIRLHKAVPDSLGLAEAGRINVALAFYVIHEVPDAERLMQEVFSLLVQGGTYLIVEPMFVVSASEFEKTLALAISAGFRRADEPSVFLSRAVLLMKGDVCSSSTG